MTQIRLACRPNGSGLCHPFTVACTWLVSNAIALEGLSPRDPPIAQLCQFGLRNVLQGRSPVGIKLTSCVDAATSSTMDAWDISELRIFIGHHPPTHLLTAKHLILLEWYWDCFHELDECSCSPHAARALSLAGSGHLSNVIALKASMVAPFIFSSRRSLTHTFSQYMEVHCCTHRLGLVALRQ